MWTYYFLSRIFGITFGIKLMELREKNLPDTYEIISAYLPVEKRIITDTEEHEKKLIALIDEERLNYTSSIVLGINDALVELTGTLAGLTFALQNTRLIALAGLITGSAAALSMAASEYLSTKSETEKVGRNPLKASVYTGTVYLFTVAFLIYPYLIFTNLYLSLSMTILNAILVIIIFTFYISVAKGLSFRKRFTEMATISLGVAAISFFIGFLLRGILNI